MNPAASLGLFYSCLGIFQAAALFRIALWGKEGLSAHVAGPLLSLEMQIGGFAQPADKLRDCAPLIGIRQRKH